MGTDYDPHANFSEFELMSTVLSKCTITDMVHTDKISLRFCVVFFRDALKFATDWSDLPEFQLIFHLSDCFGRVLSFKVCTLRRMTCSACSIRVIVAGKTRPFLPSPLVSRRCFLVDSHKGRIFIYSPYHIIER
jgi:hypothetical protein